MMLITACPAWVIGQNSASTTVATKASVIDIIKLIKVDDMNFGKISNGASGTVEVTTDGERNSTGITTVGVSGWAPAKFEVRGANNYEYIIGLPNDITIENGDYIIMIKGLVARASDATENGLTGIIKPDSYFTVGGKLIIESATLPIGSYTKSFEVSAGYN